MAYRFFLNVAALSVVASGCAQQTHAVDPSSKDLVGSGLVAAYAFEEGQGTVAADSSGDGLNGTISKATWTTGKFGKALRFSGKQGCWVTVADAAALHLTTGMTVSAWVLPTSMPTESAVLFKERPSDLTYALYANGPSGQPNSWVTVSDSEQTVNATSPISTNTWTHLATTFDGSKLSIYVNGVLANQTPLAGPVDSVPGVLRIGGDSIWTNEGFIGTIDEVRIYNRALSASEIQSDMTTPIIAPASIDAGAPPIDSGTPPHDSGTPPHDSGTPPRDSGTPPIDLGADTTPPTGAIHINSGATSTNHASVTLTLTAADSGGVTQMRFSNDGTSFAAAVPFAGSATWSLTNGDGPKTVYVQFKDTAGNWSGAFSASIVLDTVAPTISNVSASSTSPNSATISWSTNEAATSTVDYGTTTAYGQSSPINSSLISAHGVGLSGLTGTTTYHFRARSSDAAGNEVVGSDGTFTTAAAGAVTVVSSTQIHQDWGAAAWSSGTIPITGVAAGDAIIALGIYWDSSAAGHVTGPSDNNGHFLVAEDQGPVYVVGGTLPVIAQIYYQLNVAAGTHVITPPDLGGGDGDGTLYVLQVRGLSPSASLIGVGDSHALGTALPSVSVNLSGSALAGDFVVAVGGEDDAVGSANPNVSNPPAGWQSIGVQNDGQVNVPSEACYRLAPSSGNQTVTWTWLDPTANVTTAAIAAFR